MPAIIKAIFFTRFLEKQGTRVIHQVPPGSVVPEDQLGTGQERRRQRQRRRRQQQRQDRATADDDTADPPPLLDFAAISDYLIPRWPFCDQAVSIRVSPRLRVIGHPVCIEDDSRYGRGRFLFNLAVVVVTPMFGDQKDDGDDDDNDGDDDDDDGAGEKSRSGEKDGPGRDRTGRARSRQQQQQQRRRRRRMVVSPGGYELDRLGDIPGDFIAVISKLARLLRGLEELTGFLSRDDDNDGDGGRDDGRPSRVYSLCEMIMEDLNNYSECMIPIDDANTVNLKLFPPRPPPPTVVPSTAVPVIITNLPVDAITTDLTVRRLLPFMTAGIHPLGEIAVMSGIHLALVRKAVQHLLYYDCVVLMDMPFSFSAVYAATPAFPAFLSDRIGLAECAAYVVADVNYDDDDDDDEDENNDAKKNDGAGVFQDRSVPKAPGPSTLIQLYASLVRRRRPVREWVLAHWPVLTAHSIDVRRFVVFGLLQGFLYCVRKWAVVVEEPMKSALGVIALAQAGPDDGVDGGAAKGKAMGMSAGPGITGGVGPVGLMNAATAAHPIGPAGFGSTRFGIPVPERTNDPVHRTRPSRVGEGSTKPTPIPPIRTDQLHAPPSASGRRQSITDEASLALSPRSDLGSGNADSGCSTRSGDTVARASVSTPMTTTTATTGATPTSGLSVMVAKYNNLVGTHPVDRLCAKWAMSERDVMWWLTRQRQQPQVQQQQQQQQQPGGGGVGVRDDGALLDGESQPPGSEPPGPGPDRKVVFVYR